MLRVPLLPETRILDNVLVRFRLSSWFLKLLHLHSRLSPFSAFSDPFLNPRKSIFCIASSRMYRRMALSRHGHRGRITICKMVEGSDGRLVMAYGSWSMDNVNYTCYGLL